MIACALGLSHAVRMDALIAAFLNHAEATFRRPDGRPTGTAANREIALRELRARYHDLRAEDMTPELLRKLRGVWAASGLRLATINDRTRVVQQMFRWGAELGMVGDQTAFRLSGVRPLRKGMAPENPPVDAVELETVTATLPLLKSANMRDLIRWMLATACRPGDAIECRSAELDLTQRLWSPAWHKTARHGVHRAIPLNDAAIAIAEPRMHKPHLFGCGLGARPMTKGSVYTAVSRACERGGITHWSPNQIRHLAGRTVYRRHGMTAAMELLGHTSERTTRRYLGVCEIDHARRGVPELEELVERTSEPKHLARGRDESGA